MGFDAIWISPVIDNFKDGYHGYWGQDWTKPNDNFGTDEDLKSLVKMAHEKGMFVMVDVVANHVAPVGTDYSSINPFNTYDHYHSYCEVKDDSTQTEMENCRLNHLPDLD